MEIHQQILWKSFCDAHHPVCTQDEKGPALFALCIITRNFAKVQTKGYGKSGLCAIQTPFRPRPYSGSKFVREHKKGPALERQSGASFCAAYLMRGAVTVLLVTVLSSETPLMVANMVATP